MAVCGEMSQGDDPFLPQADPLVSLEIDDGFAGSSRKKNSTGVHRAGADTSDGEVASSRRAEQGAERSGDAFGPVLPGQVALDVDKSHPSNRKKRATLSAHEEFIQSTNRRLHGFTSYEEEQAEVRRLYWRLTRIPVLLLLAWFSLSHLALDAEWVFIDGVNLAFHEAGHPMFRWAGDTMYFLGGTLGQLMWPSILVLYFYFKRGERFGAVVCLWWVGENLVNIARYMRDAPTQDLPLVGGDTHDWNYLFGKWDIMERASDLADLFRILGAVTMIASLAYLLWMTLRPNAAELAEGFRA